VEVGRRWAGVEKGGSGKGGGRSGNKRVGVGSESKVQRFIDGIQTGERVMSPAIKRSYNKLGASPRSLRT